MKSRHPEVPEGYIPDSGETTEKAWSKEQEVQELKKALETTNNFMLADEAQKTLLNLLERGVLGDSEDTRTVLEALRFKKNELTNLHANEKAWKLGGPEDSNENPEEAKNVFMLAKAEKALLNLCNKRVFRLTPDIAAVIKILRDERVKLVGDKEIKFEE